MEEIKTIAIIIPNEEVLDVPIYYEECSDDTRHHEDMIKTFIKRYNIPALDEYDLVASGHIFLRAVDNLVICYMPSKITKLQYEILLKHRNFLSKFPIFLANFYKDDLLIENSYGEYDTKGRNIIDCFYEEIENYYFKGNSRS